MDSPIQCTVYIDESGDLGVNRGTKYFVITAVIVDKDEEESILKTIRSIKNVLNVQKIHMRETRNFNKQSYIVRELNKHEFIYTNVVVDTEKLTRKDSTIIYNYACRILLERVSWCMRDTNRRGTVILSARSTSRDNDLINYIKNQLLNTSNPTVKISNVFDDIIAKQFGSWDLLSLADVCATSTFWSFEKNSLGFTQPCFSKAMSSHLYRYGKDIWNYGLKYYSKDMEADLEELKLLMPCAEK